MPIASQNLAVAALLPIKGLHRNQYGGIDLDLVYEYLIVDELPTTVILMDILLTLVGDLKPFELQLRLIDPSQGVVFSIDEKLAFTEKDNPSGYVAITMPVFFWLKEAGEHYFEVYADDKLIKRRLFHIFKSGQYEKVRPASRHASLVGVLIGNEGDFDTGAPRLWNVLTDEGIYQGFKIALLTCFDNVFEVSNVSVKFCDSNGTVVDSAAFVLKPQRDGIYSSLHLYHHVSVLLPPGVNWIVLEGEEWEIKHPILIKESIQSSNSESQLG